MLNILKMATNKPYWDSARKGAVKNREQVFNPRTEQWVKIDTETRLFMDVKQDWTPFKWVRKK